MWWWDRVIEDKIETARRNGYFDNLRGQGKPLKDDESDLAGEDWLANHLMKEAGILPEWLSLRKDIAQERPKANAFYHEAVQRLNELPNRLWPTDARLKRLIELYLKQARKVNLMVDQHNHRCPSIRHELIRLREDAIDRAREKIRDERASQYLRQREGAEPDR